MEGEVVGADATVGDGVGLRIRSCAAAAAVAPALSSAVTIVSSTGGGAAVTVGVAATTAAATPAGAGVNVAARVRAGAGVTGARLQAAVSPMASVMQPARTNGCFPIGALQFDFRFGIIVLLPRICVTFYTTL